MRTLKKNPTFKDLIPPLSHEELTQLTENILAHGCRDPIKAWNGVIVDGHNRYAICQQHGIPYRVEDMRFSSKKAAARWIIDNQLARRNLTDTEKISLAVRKVEMMLDIPRHTSKRAFIAEISGESEYKVRKYLKATRLALTDPQRNKLQKRLEKGDTTVAKANLLLEPGCGLKVKIKEVTELYHGDDHPEAATPRVIDCMFDNGDKIEKIYRFLLDKVEVAGGDEELACIQVRLRRNIRCIGKILCPDAAV